MYAVLFSYFLFVSRELTNKKKQHKKGTSQIGQPLFENRQLGDMRTAVHSHAQDASRSECGSACGTPSLLFLDLHSSTTYCVFTHTHTHTHTT